MWTFRTDSYTFPQYDAVGIRRFASTQIIHSTLRIRSGINHLRKQSSRIEFLFSFLFLPVKDSE